MLKHITLLFASVCARLERFGVYVWLDVAYRIFAQSISEIVTRNNNYFGGNISA